MTPTFQHDKQAALGRSADHHHVLVLQREQQQRQTLTEDLGPLEVSQVRTKPPVVDPRQRRSHSKVGPERGGPHGPQPVMHSFHSAI